MFAGRWVVQALGHEARRPAHDSAQLLDHQPPGQRHGHVVFHLGQERRGRRADQPAAGLGGVLQPHHGHPARAAQVPMPDIGLLRDHAARSARPVECRSPQFLAHVWRATREVAAPFAASVDGAITRHAVQRQPPMAVVSASAPARRRRRHRRRMRKAAQDILASRRRCVIRPARLPPHPRRAICCGWRWRCWSSSALASGIRDPWPADEPRFAAMARDMVADGRVAVPARGRRSLPGQTAAVLLAAGDQLRDLRFGEGVVPGAVVPCRGRRSCS